MKKYKRLLSVVILSFFIFNTACAGTKDIMVVTDLAGVNDNSWNQLIWEGVQKDNDKANFHHITSLEIDIIKDMDLVLAASSLIGDTMIEFANENPKISVGIMDISIAEEELKDNLFCVNFKVKESSFLAGYVAGKTTTTNKIGFIGGMDFDTINQFYEGFKAGVLYANPNAECTSSYIGTFTDEDFGHLAAEKLYDSGCDVIMHAAGKAGFGVIRAAEERGQWVVGVDEDQTRYAPENVLTSVVKNVGDIAGVLIGDYINGKKIAGKVYSYGIDSGFTGLSPNNGNISDDLYREVTEVIASKIISGEIII